MKYTNHHFPLILTHIPFVLKPYVSFTEIVSLDECVLKFSPPCMLI